MLKITLAELELKVAKSEWPIWEFKHDGILYVHTGGLPDQWKEFPLDPNRMLDIQKRDGLWPATSKIQNILYNLGYVVFIEQLKITIWNHDPLTCVKLAYAKLHNLFDGQELEVV